MLWEAAEGQPHLVVKSQLLVLREPVLDVLRDDMLPSVCVEGGIAHVSEMLGQADHLGALVGALFDQARTDFVVSVWVLCCAELHKAHDTAERVLFRRQ